MADRRPYFGGRTPPGGAIAQFRKLLPATIDANVLKKLVSKSVFLAVIGVVIVGSAVSCQSLNTMLTKIEQPEVTIGQPRATILSPADDSVPEWRIGYRVYLTYADFRVPEERWAELLNQVQLFANDVYQFSDGGLRVSVDVFDMGPTEFPGNAKADDVTTTGLPNDRWQFQSAGDYHSVFYTFPWSGPPYQGSAEGSAVVAFPMGRTEGGTWSLPWELLLLHEFLHLLVYHYSSVDWPDPDVHGAKEHGYSSYNPMVDARYFADLMQGSVIERRRLKGIRPSEYADYGLPVR